LPLINGAAKLKSSSFHDVAIGAIRDHDEGETRQHVVIQAATVELRTKADAVLIKAGEEPPKPPSPGSLDSDRWVKAASMDAYRGRALALWVPPTIRQTCGRSGSLCETTRAWRSIPTSGAGFGLP
jgi:hypothetical protein